MSEGIQILAKEIIEQVQGGASESDIIALLSDGIKYDAREKNCNIPRVNNSVCDCCVPRPEDPFEYDNPICEKCGLPIKQTDC